MPGEVTAGVVPGGDGGVDEVEFGDFFGGGEVWGRGVVVVYGRGGRGRGGSGVDVVDWCGRSGGGDGLDLDDWRGRRGGDRGLDVSG